MQENQDDGDAANAIEGRRVREHSRVSYPVRFWLPRALPLTAAALLLLESFVIAPRIGTVAVLAAILWMALPGVVFARAVLGPASVAAWLVGPALGFAFSVSGVLLVWLAGAQNWIAIAAGPALTWAVAAIARRFGGPTLRLPAFDRRDIAAVALALTVVPIVTWAPYDHVRERVPDGEAYRAYFTADFVWAMTVTAELAKGDVPPANPFLKDDTLHYYWMAHFLSGALYRNTRSLGMTAEEIVLLDGLAFGAAFVAFFYALARIAGASPAFAALAVAIGFLANSYEALNRMLILYERGAPFEAMRDYNIDAVTRWFYQGMPVDGLQRLLLYQPHHLTGYVAALAALWLVGFAEDVTETSVALWAGILLGLTFLFSTFTAILVGAAVALLFAVRLIARRAYRALWQCAILGAGPAIVGAALTSMLGYTDPKAGLLIELGSNPVALRRWPLMWLLSFGPLLFAGIAGLARVRWVRRDGAAAATLALSATAFYFLTDVPDMAGVWVGWRSGHQLLIAFAIIGAAAATAVWQHRGARMPLVLAIALAILPAIPTVAIDVYNAQDINNRNPGPNFPWTLIITPPERDALEWLKGATPPDATVQYEPQVRGAAWWGYITAFGERRMAAGLPIAMIPLRPYQEATENVRASIFRASDAESAHTMATFMGIDYILVGDVERRHYPDGIAAMAARPELFPPVFKNDAVAIYGITKARK
jgi:hypothetical protein